MVEVVAIEELKAGIADGFEWDVDGSHIVDDCWNHVSVNVELVLAEFCFEIIGSVHFVFVVVVTSSRFAFRTGHRGTENIRFN